MNLDFVRLAADGTPEQRHVARRQTSRSGLRARLHIFLISLDVACIYGGFFSAGLLYPTASAEEHWLLLASLLTPIYLGIALSSHAFATAVIENPGRGIMRSMQAFFIAVGVVVLVAFSLKTSDTLSRGTTALGVAISLLLLVVARSQFLRKAKQIVGGNPYNVVLLSDGDLPACTAGASILLSTEISPDTHVDTPEMYDRLATMLKDADRVVVMCPPQRRVEWARLLKGTNVRSEILMPELAELAPLGIDQWNGLPTVVVANGALGSFDSFVKRSFDLVVAISALLVLLPLLLIVALVVKLESPGPALFMQVRIGRGNKLFKMYKFRSMHAARGDQSASVLTTRDDDRVTKVGKFIRKTSIDELPQLVNVLKGQMSIVGPRPHALGARAADKLYWEVDKRYWHRHAAKPGLTGLAQVRGHRGATSTEQHLTDRLQADLEYLNHWSIWKDIKIVAMTIGVVMHSNAY